MSDNATQTVQALVRLVRSDAELLGSFGTLRQGTNSSTGT